MFNDVCLSLPAHWGGLQSTQEEVTLLLDICIAPSDKAANGSVFSAFRTLRCRSLQKLTEFHNQTHHVQGLRHSQHDRMQATVRAIHNLHCALRIPIMSQ